MVIYIAVSFLTLKNKNRKNTQVYFAEITDNYIPFHGKFLITGLCSSARVLLNPQLSTKQFSRLRNHLHQLG